MFNSIDLEVMNAYQLSSTSLGLLSSVYFYSTVALLLPAGQILDRLSPKKVIMLTMVMCITGIVGFSWTSNIVIAGICRFFEGVGSAFCFLGSFKIASNWFNKNKLVFVSGLIITMGMFGGVVAQTPLTLLISKFGWREALFLDAILGVLILAIVYVFVSDSPIHCDRKRIDSRSLNYISTLKIAYANRNNWACGLYTCLMNSPMVLLGALWGSLYLEQIHHLSRKNSSVVISMIFIGTILGSPIFGFLSNIIKRKRLLMISGSVLTMFVILLVIFASSISYTWLTILFFLLGLFSSSQVLGYPMAAQNGLDELSAMSASVVSFTTMAGYIILQPLFGFVMDLAHDHKMVDGIYVYTVSSYCHALFLIPAAVILACASLIFIKEPKI